MVFLVCIWRNAFGFPKRPENAWDGVRDTTLPGLKIVGTQDYISKKGAVRFLSNSFAFGGNNCSLVLGREFSSAGVANNE